MIQKAMPFQAETVKCVIKAFSSKAKSGRFLIADEVGLGKTVVARNVIQVLAERAHRKKRSFTVFYFASNLELLDQNRKSIRKAGLSNPALSSAEFSGDRLGTYLAWQPATDASLRVAVFTPGTSLPDRAHGAAATGTRDERALAVALSNLTCPGLISRNMREALALGTTKKGEGARATKAFEDFEWRCRSQRARLLQRNHASRRVLLKTFTAALADELQINTHTRLKNRRRAARELFQSSGAQGLRRRLRSALCRSALLMPGAQPDLVILDEFQRYRDLLEEDDKTIAGTLFAKANVLLMSATPFSNPARHEKQHPLIGLVEFLYAGAGPRVSKKVERALKTYHQLIAPETGVVPPVGPERADWSRRVLNAKTKLEKLLRPIMERTERRDDIAASGVVSSSVSADVEADDLRIFDDFAARLRAAARRKRHRGVVSHATPLWLSIPYPVQTLPSGYVAAAALQRARGIDTTEAAPRLLPPASQKAPSTLPPAIAHPKLRSILQGENAVQELALPWMPPSLPWWRLTGIWSKLAATATKSLVFSHFRATPPSVGALVSREVERQFGSRRVAWNNIPRQGRYAVGGGKRPLELLSLFYPWERLAKAFDPCGSATRSLNDVLEQAHAKAEELLTHTGIDVRRRIEHPVKLHELLAHLETCDEQGQYSRREHIREFATIFEHSGSKSIFAVRPQDVTKLAQYMVGAPGIVLLRAILRHFNTLTPEDIEKTQELAWGSLRLYLGRRYFERAIPPLPATNRRPSRQADRMGLLSAIAAGNLESVLDEQLFAARRIGALKNDTPIDALSELDGVLSLPAGSLSLHRVAGGKRKIRGRLRAHAAVAFAGQESGGTGGSRAEVRPAALRSAFNSPFWPHLLATTAVGQEGLDFHLWCQRIIHWDIPPDPLALEQREGRIMRYACLAVRRALAQQHGTDLLLSEDWKVNSPWIKLGAFVDKVYSTEKHATSGLTPWWVTSSGTYERRLSTLTLSRDDARFRKLLTDLDLYRLAIGQPNPEQFISRVDGKLCAEELRKFAIDLSSTRLRSSQAAAVAQK